MRSSDLDPQVKKQLLKGVRDHIGSTEYDKMVDTVGEDGLLDGLLHLFETQGGDSGGRSPGKSWGGGSGSASSSVGAGEVVKGIFAMALLGAVIYGIAKAVPWLFKGIGQWWGWLGGHFG